LATDRIAVAMADGSMSYAAAARWNEPATRVVQERVLTAFENDPRVRAAVRPEDAAASRYEVRFDLRDFEADYRRGPSAAPTAVVSLRAKLLDRQSRELIASSPIDVQQLAAANRMGDIVAAFNAAVDEASRQVVAWTLASAPTSAAQPSVSAASRR